MHWFVTPKLLILCSMDLLINAFINGFHPHLASFIEVYGFLCVAVGFSHMLLLELIYMMKITYNLML